MVASIFKNIYEKTQSFPVGIDNLLARIKDGKIKDLVLEIRAQLDKDRADKMKCNLPSVCFSGVFKTRTDKDLVKHSGFIALDFDNVDDLENLKKDLSKEKFVYAAWVSPSGKGLKALVKIADGSKHREHFNALKSKFPSVDKSGVNESRVCYESYDENIYINPSAKAYTRTETTVRVLEPIRVENKPEIFEKILKWLSNSGNAFATGERNAFIYKLSSACCRFGMDESECLHFCIATFQVNQNGFSISECQKAVASGYKSSRKDFGTAEFSKDTLVDRKLSTEIKIVNPDLFNLDIKPKDVIYGEDVKEAALNLYDNGYDRVDPIGIPEIDELFKFKRGEITLLSGHGNYGKSSLFRYMLLMKMLVSGEKFALFSPEDNPAHEFYHSIVEVYLGCDCTPKNHFRPSKSTYEKAYDYISKNIFYAYPKDISPTPSYIKEIFLELIIKEGISGCFIDPFNQMSNDYTKNGNRSDKYLETFLADCAKFAQVNNVYFGIVCHPKQMTKVEGNYPCPDVYDLADGAMWNAKMDNILIYHKPFQQTEPENPTCDFYTKKIRRHIVGKRGSSTFDFNRKKRRFIFNGVDYMEKLLTVEQAEIKLESAPETYGDILKKESEKIDHYARSKEDPDYLPF